MADAQQFYFSLELGVDENVGRMILFHLIASILGFYINFPELCYKTRNTPPAPHSLPLLRLCNALRVWSISGYTGV